MRPELRTALAAALLALALGARAAADESAELAEATRLLLAPELRSHEARAQEASELLTADRNRKLADLSAAFVDLGLHASVQASPLRILRSVRDIGRDVRDRRHAARVLGPDLGRRCGWVRAGRGTTRGNGLCSLN